MKVSEINAKRMKKFTMCSLLFVVIVLPHKVMWFLDILISNYAMGGKLLTLIGEIDPQTIFLLCDFIIIYFSISCVFVRFKNVVPTQSKLDIKTLITLLSLTFSSIFYLYMKRLIIEAPSLLHDGINIVLIADDYHILLFCFNMAIIISSMIFCHDMMFGKKQKG